jgi:hypothetical protein
VVVAIFHPGCVPQPPRKTQRFRQPAASGLDFLLAALLYNPRIAGRANVPRIFVSQQRVQQWTEEGRVAVDGSVMNLPELGRTFKLTEAFFVQRVVSEGGDAFKLTGRVKTRAQIAAIGGEVFLNSLIIGDAAYEGDPGYVGEALPSSKPVAPPPAVPTAGLRSRRDGISQSGQPAAPVQPLPSSRDRSSILGVGAVGPSVSDPSRRNS